MGLRSLTITLSDDVAKRLDDKVASGEYGSPSEAVEDGLRLLDVPDFDDATLMAAIRPAYEAYRREPKRAIPADEVFDGLDARYQARKRARSNV
jgi:antitoxin ParD1/3/4